MIIQTVCSTNYLDKAYAMIHSIERYHPELRIAVLVTDITNAQKQSLFNPFPQKLTILTCEDLNVAFIPQMRTYYDKRNSIVHVKFLRLNINWRMEMTSAFFWIQTCMLFIT